ncbi:hypothetical protein A3Q56_05613 [Intoshia linei]|uniref:Trafficking protein particle complex subunit n=1 Tax=Intoshia linei TaxID=1819745 RepID=A0A177AXH1_9BILA|nr:hypothetical protein A3Q56_05613 [Intoshia linei]
MSRKSYDNRTNSDLFSATYGSLVVQMIEDLPDMKNVNDELFKLGFDMGQRLADDYFSRTNTRKCENMPEMANSIGSKAFPLYLNANATVSKWSADGKEFSIIFEHISLMNYVQLPEKYSQLKYLNILCGAIKGCLHMVQLKVEVAIVEDMFVGDAKNEIRIKYLHKIN